jgi:AraC family transcriptional regulator
MQPRIETLSEKKLIGKSLKMTFANNMTIELWHSFMPRRNEIYNNISSELFSIQIYPPLFFDNFNPNVKFEKWAAIEVTDFDTIPVDMMTFTLIGGLYAVFLYKGAASVATSTFQYILGTWLPNSDYNLDNRPHFEILGEKYKNEDPDSEEEIWIPIKMKI